MYADTYGIYAAMLTRHENDNLDAIYMSPNLQIGV